MAEKLQASKEELGALIVMHEEPIVFTIFTVFEPVVVSLTISLRETANLLFQVCNGCLHW